MPDRANPVEQGENAQHSPLRGKARRWRFVRKLINFWLIYHLFAICIAPASVAPASNLEQSLWLLAKPYLQVLFLNHGFHFFSPEPGGSTLLGYTLQFEDGHFEQGRLPNRSIQPRLLYHRHFMQTEFLSNVPPELAGEWHRAYARELLRAYPHAMSVSLSKILHALPSRAFVISEGRLDDPKLYTEEPLGVFSRSELLPDEEPS